MMPSMKGRAIEVFSLIKTNVKEIKKYYSVHDMKNMLGEGDRLGKLGPNRHVPRKTRGRGACHTGLSNLTLMNGLVKLNPNRNIESGILILSKLMYFDFF